MLDELAALWDRLTGWVWRTAIGGRLNAGLGRFRAAPPLEDGYYLASASRFEIGKLRNVMRRYGSRRQLRSLAGTLERWRRFPQSYLILKRAERGRCVEPFAGATVVLGLSDAAGKAVLSGARPWTSVKTRELKPVPANYIYGQFAEALEKHHRAALMRLVLLKTVEMGTSDAWVIVRPVTEAALHFYQKRGFVRPDGSPPVLDEICATQAASNAKFQSVLRAFRAADNT